MVIYIYIKEAERERGDWEKRYEAIKKLKYISYNKD